MKIKESEIGQYIGEAQLSGKPDKHLYPVTRTKYVFEGNETQEQINKRIWDEFKKMIHTKGTLSISEDGYWIVDGVKTEVKAKGEKGEDGAIPLIRVTSDGMSLEVSYDNGATWQLFIMDFNKLRVIGYVDSVAQLPKNALLGDIYGVWNQEAQEGVGAYELYINTVRDWVEDYTITKVYDYDTELPSSATDGTAVLVPVTDLTLDKEKVDGYKVYKYSLANNGWIMVLNTAEIYAGKEDIINYGDNVYALVQGDTEGTYKLYRRETGWVFFGTNASISYQLIQDILQGTTTNVLSGKAVKDAIEAEAFARQQAISDVNTAISELDTRTTENLDAFKQEVKDTYGDYTESPEFVRVVLDNEEKVLYGVQKDGNFYFGAGCPQQVKDYVQQKIDTIMGVGDITEKIDTINEMIAFFDEISHDTTLKELLAASAQDVAEEKTRAEAAEQHLNEVKANKEEVNVALNIKVDKEEGKSLINSEFAEAVHYIESPEFAEIKLDAEERILEAIYKDGTKLLPAGVKVNGVAEYDGATVTTISNPEFTAVWLDSSDRILLGIKNNADILFGYGVPSQIKAYIDEEVSKFSPEGIQEIIDFIGEYLGTTTLQELLNKKVDGEYIENPEYIEAKLDSEDKVLEGIREDGTKVIGSNLQVLGSLDINGVTYSVVSNPEWLKAVVDADNKIICGIKTDGRFYVGNADFLDDIETIKVSLEELNIFNSVESPEFVDIKMDAEDKIAEAIREDGTKVLPAGVETPKVNLEGATIENKANPEYIEVKLAADDKLLEGTRTDGTKVIGGNLEVGGDMKIGGEVNFTNGIPQEIVDYVAANTGSGVSNIKYDDETGDMYATYDEADGVTDVWMEENGDIYAEIEK